MFDELFIDSYLERVAIMWINGDKDAERNAYEDTVRAIQEKTGKPVECFPSLEQCQAAEQHLRITG